MRSLGADDVERANLAQGRVTAAPRLPVLRVRFFVPGSSCQTPLSLRRNWSSRRRGCTASSTAGAEIEARPAGVAAIDREYAVGSGRVDLLVRWPLPDGGVERFAAELKVRRDGDGDLLEDGLEQLGDYLSRLGLDAGTLVLFDQREKAPSIGKRCSRGETEQGGRRITVLRL